MSDKKYTSIHREDAAGRIDFKGGKAVWEWSQEANDSTSILIKSLDNPELELEKTQRTPLAGGPWSGKQRVSAAPARPSKAAPNDTASPEDEQPTEGDTLRQLRAMRGRSFDPYNRS